MMFPGPFTELYAESLRASSVSQRPVARPRPAKWRQVVARTLVRVAAELDRESSPLPAAPTLVHREAG